MMDMRGRRLSCGLAGRATRSSSPGDCPQSRSRRSSCGWRPEQQGLAGVEAPDVLASISRVWVLRQGVEDGSQAVPVGPERLNGLPCTGSVYNPIGGGDLNHFFIGYADTVQVKLNFEPWGVDQVYAQGLLCEHLALGSWNEPLYPGVDRRGAGRPPEHHPCRDGCNPGGYGQRSYDHLFAGGERHPNQASEPTRCERGILGKDMSSLRTLCRTEARDFPSDGDLRA